MTLLKKRQSQNNLVPVSNGNVPGINTVVPVSNDTNPVAVNNNTNPVVVNNTSPVFNTVIDSNGELPVSK